jgi:hypothetical protein
MSEHVKAHGWRDRGPMLLECGAVRAFTKGGCRVFIAQEDRHGTNKQRWHLSISRQDRYPGWDEIKDARYSLLPLGLTFAMILPPPNEYVNIHGNCFHLWEIEDK